MDVQTRHAPDPDDGSLSERSAAQALSICAEGVLIVAAQAPDFPILYVNPALCRLSGYQPASLVGQACTMLNPADGIGAIGALLQAALDGSCAEPAACCLTRDDGSILEAELRIALVAGSAGVDELVCLLAEPGGARTAPSQSPYLFHHDALSGLADHSQFDERLRQAVGLAEGDGGVAVLCLALDGLGLIDESMGQVAAGQFLAGIAQRLQACLREQDSLSRNDANEFIMILGGIGSAHDAAQVCEHIFRALAPPLPVAGQYLYPACSIGIARHPHDGGDGPTLLRHADMALRDACARGGNRYQFFASDMTLRTAERAEMETALRTAIATDQLELFYQPMADLQKGTVCALEALVRWNHPTLGLLGAGQFIPLAEDAGLNTAIGHWCLHRACEDMRAWREAGLPLVRVALNISPRQFRDPELAQTVMNALTQAGIGPEQLSLEITEAALTQDARASTAVLAQLKALRIGLTLDDFGTGYSSLNHLKRYLDLVKIDGSLIRNLDAGSGDAALVKTIIAMAHHLGIEVSAEGVETEAQCDFLRRNMCDQIQGYFFGAPCAMSEIGALLAARHAVPPHLLRIQRQKRTLLLVDDEQNIVSAVKRLLRRDDYQILTASSGQEGLDVLAANVVDVIVSDQRMPGMIGADFLRAAKGLYPDTIRIMLSGYTELQSVTDAVNEGAIYKFLTKPWDDEQLRGHIAEAFRLKEIADDNERLNLELRTANHELASTNRRMEDLLRQKQQQITRDGISLNVARELLQYVPLPVIGLDDDDMVVFINAAADRVFGNSGALLGGEASVVLAELFPAGPALHGSHETDLGGRRYRVLVHPMGANSTSRGSLITLSPCEDSQ